MLAEAGAGPYKARRGARSRALRAGVLTLAFLASAMTPELSVKGDTERVSIDSAGADPDGASQGASVSADGRYVAFASEAEDLVADDANGNTDVFVYDRATETTERVSLDTSGGDPDGFSSAPVISADGRYVAFRSGASDLVAGDANSHIDVFVYDRQSDATERISLDTTGAGPDSASHDPAISADGRYVAFASDASDLVAGDGNFTTDVFVRDRQAGTTEQVSLDTDGGDPNGESSAPAISADGRHVAFESAASDLVAGDAGPVIDVFVHDREADTTERVSIDTAGADPDGASHDPAISADGRYIAFPSSASDLVAGDTTSSTDVFLRDRLSGTTERVSLDTGGGDPDGESSGPAITADGRYVAFQSLAGDLVAGDANSLADVFVYDRQAGTTARVSLDTTAADPNGSSSGTAISADGRYVAFHSAASDLVAGDANSLTDVFVHDFLGPPELLLAPPVHAFGAREVAAGPTEPFTLTVSNMGGGTMNVASIGLGGVHASQFQIVSHTCGTPVAGGASCDVEVAFDPSSAGAVTATLEVASDGGDASSALSGLGLAGTGTSPPPSSGSDPGSGPGSGSQTGPGSGSQTGSTVRLAQQLRCAGQVATIVGSGGGEAIEGTAGRDVIAGTSGDDLIRGRGGRDLICGRGGDDRVLGGGGGDELHGNAGADRLAGHGGRDTLYGHGGADVLSGDSADDRLHGGGGRDRLEGGGGSDRLHGDGGEDRCRGGPGSDSQRAC